METQTALYPLWMLAGPLAYGALALLSVFYPGSRKPPMLRAARISTWIALAASVLGAVFVLRHGSLETPLAGLEGLGLSLRLDALSALMLVMIALLALVIMRYSATYLDGDPRQGAFLGRLGATIAAVQCLVMSGNLALFFVAWVATGWSLQRLLCFYAERPAARIAGRKKWIVSRLGELSLLGAFAMLYQATGTGQLRMLIERLAEPNLIAAQAGWLVPAALLLVLAALLQSAQFPTHGWLIEVMETPTPVSALLHAGILNAGPFLMVRFAALMETAPAAQALLIVAGGFTALFASTALLPQPAVKNALGYSSAAHMGFMLMVCGLGLYPAVMLHLVAHSFYKAHAFLASGSVIDTLRAERLALPRRTGHPARVLASLFAALAIYLGLAWLWGVRPDEHPGLLGVGAILVLGLAQIIAPALDSEGPVRAALRASGMALGVGMAFFSLESGAHYLLQSVLPPLSTMEPLRVALMAGVLIAFAGVVFLQIVGPALPPHRRLRRLAIHLRHGLYANAWFDRLTDAYRTTS